RLDELVARDGAGTPGQPGGRPPLRVVDPDVTGLDGRGEPERDVTAVAGKDGLGRRVVVRDDPSARKLDLVAELERGEVAELEPRIAVRVLLDEQVPSGGVGPAELVPLRLQHPRPPA